MELIVGGGCVKRQTITTHKQYHNQLKANCSGYGEDAIASYITPTPQQDMPHASHANIAPVVKKCYKQKSQNRNPQSRNHLVIHRFYGVFHTIQPLLSTKQALIHCKCTPFAQQNELRCIAKGQLLNTKRTTLAIKRSPFAPCIIAHARLQPT